MPPFFLRLCYYMGSDSCFTGRFRSIDLYDPSLGKPPIPNATSSPMEPVEITSCIVSALSPQHHHTAFAVILLKLIHRKLERF